MEQFDSRMLAVKIEERTFYTQAYKAYFDIAGQTEDGLLLVAK